MSKEKVLCSHELVIRFDQLEDNIVHWYITPDELVQKTAPLSLIDLAECGAPPALIGIHALWNLCQGGLIHNALEQANEINVEVRKRQVGGPVTALLDLATDGVTELLDLAPEGVTIN
jgi:hypothetical protein